VLLSANVKVTEATTPFGMLLVAIPTATQVYDPELAVQDKVLPAAVADGPAMALTELTSPGYVSVHCKAAGSLPAGEFTESANVTLPPLAVPEERVREPDWP
jgi:hypothetical protein